MFQPAITALIRGIGSILLIALMNNYNSRGNLLALQFHCTALCWQYDINLYHANLIYIKFICLNDALGFGFGTQHPFDEL